MVRADFQPPVIKKRDTPALPPSPKALSDFPMIKRVQVKMAPMLPTTHIGPNMRQEISTVLTYGDLHTDAKTIVHSTINIPYTAKTPREPPVLPRPPKPPDNKGERGQEHSNRDTNRDSRISLPQRTTLEEEKLQHTGHKKQKNNHSNHANASHIPTTYQLLTGQRFGPKCKSTIPALANGTSITSSLGRTMDHPSFGPWYIRPRPPGTGRTHGIDRWTSIFHG